MKKFFKIILIVVLLLVVSLAAIPFIFKDKILAKVKSEINNNLNAKVDFNDFGLSFFKNFPNLSMNLSNVQITGLDDFKNDTLAFIPSAAFSFNLMSVISGDKIQINAIQLDQPRIQLLVLKNGKANWDIAKAGPETTGSGSSSEFSIGLKKYSINEGYVLYNDDTMGVRMELAGLNHKGNGDFTQDLFTLKTVSDIEKMFFSYGGIAYFNNVKASIKADLDMDMVNSKYTFSENEIKLNELIFGVDGFIAMPSEDIDMDLKFDVKQNDFKNFISLIPGVYKDGFDKVESSGKLAFNGFVKGRYNEIKMPSFGIVLSVENGKFKFPDLPNSVNNVNIDLKINNPDGIPDHTLINLQKLHAEMGNEPFDAHLIVKTPVSDPDIDAGIKGRVDMGNVSKMIPLEKGTEIKGFLNADVTASGRMSAIENKMYEKFNAAGTINLKDFYYKSSDFIQGAAIQNCELIFNPKNITLNNLDLKTGRTDIKATGWLDNLLSYLLKENELLKGTMNIKAGVIDINEFMGNESTATTTDTTSSQVFEVPSNIDFLITAEAGKIYYDDLVLENAKGNVAIRNSTLGLNDFSFNMLDGTISMDGLYETKDIKNPNFFFNLDLSELDIKQVYNKFVAVQKLAPIAEKCNGKFTSVLSVKGVLDNTMAPVMTSLSGDGKLSTNTVTVNNFTPMVKVSDAIKMDQFKIFNLNNLRLSFSFEDGRVKIDPFSTNIGGINSTIEGSNGFDQSISYDLNLLIPTSLMGGSANNAISGLLANANKASGTNLSLGKEVKLKVNIGGTVTAPKIQTSLKDLASSTVDNLKDQVKQQFDDKKKELENQARDEADKLKKQGEAEAARLKKEAEIKAKAEADRLKKQAEDKLKKDAEDKLKNIFGKPK